MRRRLSSSIVVGLLALLVEMGALAGFQLAAVHAQQAVGEVRAVSAWSRAAAADGTQVPDLAPLQAGLTRAEARGLPRREVRQVRDAADRMRAQAAGGQPVGWAQLQDALVALDAQASARARRAQLTALLGSVAVLLFASACWAWLFRKVLRQREAAEREAAAAVAQARSDSLVAYVAEHDPLTGLPNRSGFRALASTTLAESAGAQVAVLVLDLDRFKDVNDTLGHTYGDELLAQVGPRLVQALDEPGAQVARLGGDEFAVLLPHVDGPDHARRVGAQLSRALERGFTVAEVDLDIEASVGVALAPRGEADIDALLRQADVAMYQAKTEHRGAVVYHPESDRHDSARLGLLGQLRRGLEVGELVLHYQPKVDLRGGALCGVEALVRWQHPEHGLLPPGMFVPYAEGTGLIHPLTEHVLELAAAQTRAWLLAGHRVPVAVNLSARSLHDTALPGRIEQLLDRHGLPPDLLRLEITESAVMIDPGGALEVLTTIARSGVRLSLDDFGTGYSSMTYLRELPVDELKVDRSFVAELGTDLSAVLVRAVVDLGHNLGLTVVAEGVEDQPTLTRLAELECDTAQGYYLARPAPAEAIDCWLEPVVPAQRAAGSLLPA